MNKNRVAPYILLVSIVSFLAGCSSNSSSSPPPIAVAVRASASAIDQAQTDNITASVSNDSKNAGVTWALSGAGSLSSSTTTAVTYNAPSSVTSTFTATITATSVSDTSKTASVQVTVNPPPGGISVTQGGLAPTAGTSYSVTISVTGGTSPFAWSVSGSLPTGLSLGTSTTSSDTISGTPTGQTSTFTVKATDATGLASSQSLTITVALAVLTTSLPAGTVKTPYTATLQAGGGVPPYSWSVTGTLPQGLTLNSSTGVISGMPTGTGTSNFTATVTDSASATANADLSIAVPPPNCPNNGNFNGSYAFMLQGWVQGQAFMGLTGSLVADGNGNVTSGQYDQNDSVNGPKQGTLTGTYCIASNNLGTLTVNSSETYAIVLQSDGNGSVISYDATNLFLLSGILLKQDTSAFSTSKFSGKYALGLAGVDASEDRYVMAGAFTSDGQGNLTNGELDADEIGPGPTNTTFSASNFTVANSGRGTASLDITALGSGNFAFYVVNATELLVIQTDAITGPLGSVLTGQVQQQSGLTGTDSDLHGIGVFGLEQVDTSCTPVCPEVTVGLLTTDGSGNITSYAGDDNDGGGVNPGSFSGTYSVSSNGRVTTSLTGINHSPILYLTGKNAGFITSTGHATFGTLQPQSGSSFGNSSLSGNFYEGSWEPLSPSVCADVNVSVVSSGSSSWTDDAICTSGPASTSGTSTFTVTANGRGVLTDNRGKQTIFYIVTPSSGGSGGEFVGLSGQGNGSYPKVMTYRQ